MQDAELLHMLQTNNDSRIYEVTDGMDFEYDDPDSCTGLIDVSNVESVEWLDDIYYRVAES